MIQLFGNTDVGVVRKQNEDGYFFRRSSDGTRGYAVVCDGMGGANAGEVASEIAVRTFVQKADALIQGAMDMESMRKTILEAAEEGNRQIYERASANEDCAGMGTTLVCMLYQDHEAVIGNIGDSRAYLLDEHGMIQVTEDHSLVQEMVKRGELTPYQAQRHPSRNVITRALGVDAAVPCDLFELTPKAGQFLLLCSDGLTGEISEPEIYYEIFQSEQPETACERLIDMAKQRGGHDNITLVVATFKGEA